LENRRWDPVTGSASAALGTANEMVSAFGGIFTHPYDEYKHAHQISSEGEKTKVPAARMALASVKSIGRFNGSFFKGTMIDIPMAVTEGLRAAPRLYGEKPREYGPISDWQSGAIVAGKVSSILISGRFAAHSL
jgi:hypothetical protein